MNIKKLLSSALTLVMIFTMLVAVIPFKTSAAHSESSVTSESKTAEEVKPIVSGSYKYNYSDANEMLNAELGLGYLDYVSSAGNQYTLYVNRYTGVAYYKNNTTGQILTSNPYAPNGNGSAAQLMSQIYISYSEVGGSIGGMNMYSATEAAERAQITVSAMDGGLRVNYTLGDTSTRYLVPGRVTAERFEEAIIVPMLQNLIDTIIEMSDGRLSEGSIPTIYEAPPIYLRGQDLRKNGIINLNAVVRYTEVVANNFIKSTYLDKDEMDDARAIRLAITTFCNKYGLQNPNDPSKTADALKKMYEDYPITSEGVAIFATDITQSSTAKIMANKIGLALPEYTFEDMYYDEAQCKYTPDLETKPVFRCALEYTFNTDGSLSVRLPANSIFFDESEYNLLSISPLQYFGAGNINNDGYMFIPDGSGAIIEFEDFRGGSAFNTPLRVYGNDYCYSKITGKNTEQVTMPVYGVVSTEKTNTLIRSLTGKTEMSSGYFAILEEGASLGNLIARVGGYSLPYGSVYAEFTPFPSDEFELDSSYTSGGRNSYTMVSKSKYSGSYVTRYVMLSDAALNSALGGGYDASYIGMANYYRDYLKENGTLTALSELSAQLPLYIEALGSMEKVEQILTFPVTVDVPLTTFDDVITMYKDLSEDNVKNVNFKLTGFANGGMYYTYPVKVDWEGAVGGSDGLARLLAYADSVNAASGSTLGVYPEFDFMYINNTAWFDGIDNKDNVSKMVDDRYGSKQLYNAISQEYETFYAMIITPDALDRLYSEFVGKYAGYNLSAISVSTLGSDLNSDFDRDHAINRDEAQGYVEDVLDRISGEYDVMVSKGNIYTLEYVKHILEMPTDSSHFYYCSYAVPFVGLIMHGYVNYAGTAMNYSGSADYDLLHSIENGASLYYILCYDNTELMKEDDTLNKYYGVDYHTWYDSMVETYNKLDWAIGDLQSYEIVDHKTLIAEREISDEEKVENTVLLLDEFIGLVEEQINDSINDARSDMFYDSNNIGRTIKFNYDADALIEQAKSALNLTENVYSDVEGEDIEEYEKTLREHYQAFVAELGALLAEYAEKYNGSCGNPYEVNFGTIEYSTQYDLVTDSKSTDKVYDSTKYTIDNNLVTMVTYRNPENASEEVVFVLNYNVYSVNITLEDGTVCTIGRHSFVKINEEGVHYYG